MKPSKRSKSDRILSILSLTIAFSGAAALYAMGRPEPYWHPTIMMEGKPAEMVCRGFPRKCWYQHTDPNSKHFTP